MPKKTNQKQSLNPSPGRVLIILITNSTRRRTRRGSSRIWMTVKASLQGWHKEKKEESHKNNQKKVDEAIIKQSLYTQKVHFLYIQKRPVYFFPSFDIHLGTFLMSTKVLLKNPYSRFGLISSFADQFNSWCSPMLRCLFTCIFHNL